MIFSSGRARCGSFISRVSFSVGPMLVLMNEQPQSHGSCKEKETKGSDVENLVGNTNLLVHILNCLSMVKSSTALQQDVALCFVSSPITRVALLCRILFLWMLRDARLTSTTMTNLLEETSRYSNKTSDCCVIPRSVLKLCDTVRNTHSGERSNQYI